MRKLYAYLREDLSQEGLSLAGSWVIGEFGDALVRAGPNEEEGSQIHVTESDIVDLFVSILGSSYANQIVTEYIVTAAMKLTTRLSDSSQIERLRRLLLSHQTDLDVETQQRAVEYVNLFGYDQIRKGVLERMPAPEIREEQRVLGEAVKKRQLRSEKKKPTEISEQEMLLDLMGGSEVPAANSNNTLNNTQNNTDLLADILGGSSITAPATNTSATNPSSTSNILDLFDNNPKPNGTTQSSQTANAANADLLGKMGAPAVTSNQPNSASNIHQAYSKNSLQIHFHIVRNADVIHIQNIFRNTSKASPITNISLQAAVPKSHRIQILAISSNNLNGGEETKQQMSVVAVNGVSTFITDIYDVG